MMKREEVLLVNPWKGNIGPNTFLKNYYRMLATSKVSLTVIYPERDFIAEEMESLGIRVIYNSYISLKHINNFILKTFRRFGVEFCLLFFYLRIFSKQRYSKCLVNTEVYSFSLVIPWFFSQVYVVVHSLSFRNNGLLNRFLLLLQKRFVFRYLAVSRTVEESLKEQGIKKNVSVVYNGVPRQTILEKKINTTEPFRILVIAYPVPHKGAHHLLEVLTLLKNEISFKCSLLGWYSESLDPIYHDHILNEIKHRGLGSMVEVFGNVEAIGEWYKSSDVLVHPSESESFGFTVAEAMSYGLPVVAFDVGALYELIDDKINGYLVPPFDYVKMVEIIKKLKEESELAILIGKAAQEKIKKKFTLEDTMLRVFNIMELLQYIVFFYVLNR